MTPGLCELGGIISSSSPAGQVSGPPIGPIVYHTPGGRSGLAGYTRYHPISVSAAAWRRFMIQTIRRSRGNLVTSELEDWIAHGPSEQRASENGTPPRWPVLFLDGRSRGPLVEGGRWPVFTPLPAQSATDWRGRLPAGPFPVQSLPPISPVLDFKPRVRSRAITT